MRRLCKSLLLVFAILAFSGYEAYACFVQGREPFWNMFGSKKMELTVDFSGYYNKPVDGHPNAGFWKPANLTCHDFFSFKDIKPGDFGEGTISLHLKYQDSWECLIIRPTENDDRSSNEPELLVDVKDNPKDHWDGELAQNMNLRIWADTCAVSPAKPGDNIYQENCDRLISSGPFPLTTFKFPLADSANKNVFTGKIESIKHDKNYFIGADWELPSGVGNIVQTDTYKADITFFAEQADGNGGFLCANTNDKEPDKCLDGATQNCYSGPERTQGEGVCRSGTETCFRGNWGSCIGEVLPGKEVCGDGIDNDCNGKIDEAGCIPPPCTKDSQCDDHNSKTGDQCVKGVCEHIQKNNFWDLCWLKKC
jgi:hypothetical protein